MMKYYFFITTIILTSCTYNNSNNHTIPSDSICSKTISFPKSLQKLNADKFSSIDSFLLEIENKNNIISIIDISCEKCTDGINTIDSVFNTILKNEDNLIFIFNFKKIDSAYFMYRILPKIHVTASILWDNNYSFERQNSLFTTEMNMRTFMINDKDKVIVYGNPIINPKVLYEYQAKLEDLYLDN